MSKDPNALLLERAFKQYDKEIEELKKETKTNSLGLSQYGPLTVDNMIGLKALMQLLFEKGVVSEKEFQEKGEKISKEFQQRMQEEVAQHSE